MKTKKRNGRRTAAVGKLKRKVVGSGALVRRLRALEKHWLTEAEAFHRMGREDYRRGNMHGKEYMQTAAAFRACARELKVACLSNVQSE